jgi:hypothetical protein
MNELKIFQVEINGQVYGVTHFSMDNKGGSFRALNFESLLWTAQSRAILLPGEIPINVFQIGPVHGGGVVSEIHFQFAL